MAQHINIILRPMVSIKDSHIENECFWNYPTVIKGAFFHEAVSHLFNRVKTQNR